MSIENRMQDRLRAAREAGIDIAQYVELTNDHFTHAQIMAAWVEVLSRRTLDVVIPLDDFDRRVRKGTLHAICHRHRVERLLNEGTFWTVAK